MSALLLRLRLLASAAGVLRWLLPAVVLVGYASTWLPIQRQALLANMLTAAAVAFAWFMIGSRVLALLHHGRTARLPGMSAQIRRLLSLGLVCTVLLPSLLYATRGAEIGLSLSLILLAASGGVLFSALPAWAITLVSFVLGVVTAFALRLAGTWMHAHPCSSMLVTASASTAITIWACYAMRSGRLDHLSPWTRPTWMSLQQGPGDGGVRQAVESQEGRMAWLQGIARPAAPRDLRHDPERAMGYALGPGFAPGRPLSSALTAICMPLLALLVWIPLMMHSGDLMLVIANSVGCFSSVKFLQRLWLWRRQANLGLLESMLLPGLGTPGRVHRVFCQLVLKRAIAAALPWAAVAIAAGLIQHAPGAYYPMVVWMQATSLMSSCAIIVACMRWPRGGLAMTVMQLGLLLLTCASVAVLLRDPASSAWLTPSWAGLLLAATGLFLLASQQLGRRPHPWLLN